MQCISFYEAGDIPLAYKYLVITSLDRPMDHISLNMKEKMRKYFKDSKSLVYKTIEWAYFKMASFFEMGFFSR